MEIDTGTDPNQKLLPRFTIRVMLEILSAFAIVFLIAGMAYRGQYWAWGITIAMGSLLVIAVVHAAWFSLIWLFAQISTKRGNSEGRAR